MQPRPSSTLCPICTKLSIIVPGPITVSCPEPRSIVVLAPISTSSPMTTRPSWGILTGPSRSGAKPKPGCPMRTPGWSTTRAPMRQWLSVTWGPTRQSSPSSTARLGARCQIGAHTVIGQAVELGDDCRVGPPVTLSHCLLGGRVVVAPGVRIGQPGFGFAPDREGPVKIPQLGRVVIGDDVDIGANTTIDRGSGHDTVIGPGTMIDNLVQIGHNVVLGRGCILAGQVGISGSTKLGDFVMAGGQAGLAGHLDIGSGARIAAKAGLMRDVASGETVCGIPAVPIASFMKQVAILQRLARKKNG